MSDIINKFEESVMAILLAAITLVPFSQVIARYIFNSGAVWALELTSFLFAWLIMFGMSYGIKVGGHIGIDTFVKIFSTKIQRIFGLLAILACLLYCIILSVGALEYIFKMYHVGLESEDLHLPLWMPLSILPIGLCMMLVRFGQIARRIVSGQQVGLTFISEANLALAEDAITDTAPGTDLETNNKK